MTRQTMNRLNRSVSGFTLIELLTVLVILAISVAIAVPYARKSNDVLVLERECLNIAETMKYAVNGAMDTRKPFRFTVDLVRQQYALEKATNSSGSDYATVEDGQRMSFASSEKVSVVGMDGFQARGDTCYSLVFDPMRVWPTASISLMVRDTARRVVIAGRHISIEDI